MNVAVAWFVFPVVLSILALGCGLLVDALTGRAMRWALVPLAGLALLIVAGQFLTLFDATAELTAPTCIALAVAGLGLGLPGRRRPRTGWAVLAAATVFAIYAAPIVASGDATFAGYIKLDDTATWMALTDRVMEHGRDLDGLAPSSYEATLAFNLGKGYPVGVFLPLGVGTELVATDVAWLIQPYLAWLAALLALGLWQLARPTASARLGALAAIIGAQSALLFGYYLWGGIKEVAAAVLIVAFAGFAGEALRRGLGYRALASLALIAAALVGVLTAGGLIWLIPALLALLVRAARGFAPVAVGGRALALAGGTALLSIPVIATGLVPPTSLPLDDGGARGNLIAPLDPAQVAGIWPAGDFRLGASVGWLAASLIAVAVLLAIAAVAAAWRSRSWGLLLYVGGTMTAAAVIYAFGSPWVDGKALATASPAIPFAAVLAGALAIASGRRLAGALAIGAVAAGVIWSNALAYRDVSLAPRDQLAELERIGEAIDGQGPTLMTEYQPYGVRHFLRDADPEGASELRRRLVSLAAGGTLPKGETTDTDAIDPASLNIYRTLVLRRSPSQSRPPAAYEVIWRGDYYEVWQRPPGFQVPARRIALGDELQPAAIPRCADVRALAAGLRPGQSLVAAVRPRVIAASLEHPSRPDSWIGAGPGQVLVDGPGEIAAPVSVPRSAPYEVWLGGSVRGEVELLVDGVAAGTARDQLQNRGEFVRLGEAPMAAGAHQLELWFGGADLHPGSGGSAAVGPLVLSRSDPADEPLIEVAPSSADRLCGRAWDWIEVRG